MFPESSSNFLLTWPSAASEIVKQAKIISKSPALLKFIADDAGIFYILKLNIFLWKYSQLFYSLDKWDESIAAIFTLLHLIPPTAQGKGKGSRADLEQAKELIVTFFKVLILRTLFFIRYLF
jgi:hypothetical protein